MNCDDVFDRITSGEFAPAQDASVESHLARCPRCRSLVEALQPALELFREAEVEEGSGYDGYSSSGDDDRPARRPVRRGVRGMPPTEAGDGLSQAALVRMAAAVILGVALGGAVTVWGRIDSAPQVASPSIGARGNELHDPGDRGGFIAKVRNVAPLDVGLLGMVVACRGEALPAAPDRTPLPSMLVAAANLTCCSDCHSSLVDGIDVADAALAKLAQSCAQCHY